MRFRLAVFAALCIGVAAGCDSAAPGEADVVGTWRERATINREFATSGVSQTILDPSRAVAGALTISGADGGTLRYVSRYVWLSGDTMWTVASVPIYGPASPDSPYAAAHFTSTRTIVVIGRGAQQRQYVAEGAAAVRWDGTRFSLLSPRTLTHSGGTVTLAGSVVPATQALDAGREALVRTYTTLRSSDPRLTTVFRADGTTSQTSLLGDGTYTLDGQWEALGDGRIRLSYRSPTTSVETRWEVRYEVIDGELHLTTDTRPCVAEAACLDDRARDYGITPGTLSDVRVASTQVLARAPG